MPTEATFFLAGLFIIAAATGWAFARYSSHGELDSIPDTINADYLRGLNLVLNRQTEEALELFVEMAKICSVPIDFLVMRGQGIKLFSFIAKSIGWTPPTLPLITQRIDGSKKKIDLDKVINIGINAFTKKYKVFSYAITSPKTISYTIFKKL